jgi:hypothetical protein
MYWIVGIRYRFQAFFWSRVFSALKDCRRSTAAMHRQHKPSGELVGDLEKPKRVTGAMLNMHKINLADEQKAYDGQL